MGKLQPTRLAVLAFLIVALVIPSLATWLYFVVLGGHPAMRVAYTVTKSIQFALPLLFVWWFACELIPMCLRSTNGLPVGIAFGLAAAAGTLTLYFLFLRNTVAFAGMRPILQEKVEGMGAASPAGFLLLGAFISVIHSFLEEYYWRWFIYARLRGVAGKVWANLISSIGFMAHHVLVLGVYLGWDNLPLVGILSLGVAVGGSFWAWQFERERTLLAPWISHLLVDCALIAIGYYQLWGF